MLVSCVLVLVNRLGGFPPTCDGQALDLGRSRPKLLYVGSQGRGNPSLLRYQCPKWRE